VLGEQISFGPFRLGADGRLLRDGRAVRLGSRGLDLLAALLEKPGTLVTKDELVQRVWPDTHVDETNLRYQIALLRKALDDGGARECYIRTISGRGYSFVGSVAKEEKLAARLEPGAEEAHNLPARLTRTIGRDDVANQIAELLRRRRFVTIVGPGGIGKTTVALAVSWSLIDSYADGVRFVDLGPLTDPQRTAATLASALELTTQPDDPLPGVLAYLRNKEVLITFDNCEQIAGEAAVIIEAILKRAPSVHVIATSREPLRAEGEYICRLSPLATPPRFDELNTAKAFTYGAIELFVERATAALDSFRLSEENLAKVCEICRRLDGIPLAIELAAARANLGLDALSARLADRAIHLMKGRRTALLHQQTLYATLEWSHDLLLEDERIVFRRLAPFRSGFTDEMAAAIVGDAAIPAAVVRNLISDLVEKSLVALDATGAVTAYRLFETTRAYAAEKLKASDDAESIALRHALYYRDLMRRSEAERLASQADHGWLSAYRSAIDDIRAAIDWALTSPANLNIAFELIILSGQFWFRLSLLRDYRERVLLALQKFNEHTDTDPAIELRLQIALGHAFWYSAHDPDVLERIFARATILAEAHGDETSRLETLWGLWAVERARGQYRAAHAAAARYTTLAKSVDDARFKSLGYRITGLTYHYLGEQELAQRELECAQNESRGSKHSYNADFQLPWELAISAMHCRVKWLKGYPDQAIKMAQQAIECARESGHWMSLVYVLSVAGCEVSLWTGDLSGARQQLEMLVDHVEIGRESSKLAQCFEFILRLREGSPRDHLIASAIEPRLDVVSTAALARLASQQVIPLPLPEIESGDSEWSRPEVLRVDAEIMLYLRGLEASSSVEEKLFQAMEMARKQTALSWELRAATSLARLWRDLGRNAAAHHLLASALNRFTEGFETIDLLRAQSLLADCR
jgi:predicted ATPase/DNA-binding winged helix-turn-helix (wHTH) protein